jgi:hypothetical protein
MHVIGTSEPRPELSRGHHPVTDSPLVLSLPLIVLGLLGAFLCLKIADLHEQNAHWLRTISRMLTDSDHAEQIAIGARREAERRGWWSP